MTDNTPVVHIGENSPEEVAFKLLHRVAATEGYFLSTSKNVDNQPDRQWILDTYAECLRATKGLRGR